MAYMTNDQALENLKIAMSKSISQNKDVVLSYDTALTIHSLAEESNSELEEKRREIEQQEREIEQLKSDVQYWAEKFEVHSGKQS